MPLHPLLARALRRHGLKRFFNSLSESTRNDFDRFIRSVKKEETRLRRLEQAIEHLAEAMEAELDPPNFNPETPTQESPHSPSRFQARKAGRLPSG